MVINFGNLPIAPIGALVGFLFLGLFLRKSKQARKNRRIAPSYADLRRKPLMTANEQEFFRRLARALPDYHVFPQVAFNALLDAQRGLCWRDRMQIRNHFDRKIADYVVCSRDTFEVIAVVELDDKTHEAEKDEKRDTLLMGAGYRVKRFQSREKPCETEIAAAFAE